MEYAVGDIPLKIYGILAAYSDRMTLLYDFMEKRTLIASWAFLLGSALFTIDASFEIFNQFSPVAFLHLLEGVLFLVGSFFLLPAASEP